MRVCVIVALVHGVACNKAVCNTAECSASGPHGAGSPFQKVDDTAVLLQAKAHVQRDVLGTTNSDSDESHGLGMEEEEDDEAEEEGEEEKEEEEEGEEEDDEEKEKEGQLGTKVAATEGLECNEAMGCGSYDQGYRGCQTKTVSGKTCQKWTSQAPHRHSRTPAKYPDAGLGNHNYCRNPDKANTIWCYTTDKKKRWEYCKPLQACVSLTGVFNTNSKKKQTGSNSRFRAERLRR